MRVSIHVEETAPEVHIPIITINGIECRMTEREFESLLSELLWARGYISNQRATFWEKLAKRYQTVGGIDNGRA